MFFSKRMPLLNSRAKKQSAPLFGREVKVTPNEEAFRNLFSGAKRLLASKAFVDGFYDARKGKPFAYDKFSEADERAYSSGRQYAQCFDGQLKTNGRVTLEAEVQFNRMVRAGIVL